MSKVTLDFDLNNTVDKEAFLAVSRTIEEVVCTCQSTGEVFAQDYFKDYISHASSMRWCLGEIRHYLRQQLKHGDLSDEAYETLASVNDRFFELVNDNDLGELIY